MTIGVDGWTLTVTRDAIRLEARAASACPACHGNSGRWIARPSPDTEACGRWAYRRPYLLPLRWPSVCPPGHPF